MTLHDTPNPPMMSHGYDVSDMCNIICRGNNMLGFAVYHINHIY